MTKHHKEKVDRRIYRSLMGISMHPTINHGIEIIIPVEVGEPSLRRQMFNIDLKQESLTVGLDLINEFRDSSRIIKEA